MSRHKASSSSQRDGPDNGRELHAYFSQLFGAARWRALAQRLAQTTQHVALDNAFVAQTRGADSGTNEASGLLLAADFGSVCCYRLAEGSCGAPVKYPPPPVDPATRLLRWYWLDAASLLPPLLLGAVPGMRVLDMCAAPGGKSLVLAMCLWAAPARQQPPPLADNLQQRLSVGTAPSTAATDATAASSSRLVVNEPDAQRRGRLRTVLGDYLPPAAVQQVSVESHRADRFWAHSEHGTFDAVLVDAPCSSDRHVLQQAATKGGAISRRDWSLRHCKECADLQVQLVVAGLRALKPGGRLVYSTCSLADVENDDVVARALAKAAGMATVVQPEQYGRVDGSPAASATEAHAAAGGAAADPAAPGASGSASAVTPLTLASLTSMFGAARTQHGVICVPDVAGYGPMYIAVLQRTDVQYKEQRWFGGGGVASSDPPRQQDVKTASHSDEEGSTADDAGTEASDADGGSSDAVVPS